MTGGPAPCTNGQVPEVGEPSDPASVPGFRVLGHRMSQAASNGWHLRAGRERDNRYAIIDGDGVTWTAVRDAASRFDTKAEAAVEQAEIVTAMGISVVVVPAHASIVIDAGEHLTCTRGHYIGRMARPLAMLEAVDSTAFVDLQGKPLRDPDHANGIPGDTFGLCRCGAWWARWGSLHTKGGWKPALAEGNELAAGLVVNVGDPGFIGMRLFGPAPDQPSVPGDAA